MLSVKDINNRRFEQARPGYKPEEVDDFLREIARDISQYQKDKEDAEKKIEVLVESVREYKKDEEALKDALIGAQKQGKAVIAEAHAQAEKILADARAKADEIIGSTRVQLEKEKHCLVKMQQEVSDFKANLLNMYKQHLEQITAIPDFDDDEDEDEEEVPVSAAPASEPAPAPQPVEQNMEATRVMENPFKQEKSASPFGDSAFAGASKTENKFGDLKFGQNK
ncbi:MAG: DivIVA domain-containing protein [Oscillospiraceae bacterium]|nr:DivIVA domain-containing protein [Oscillospiraceae bacterium]